MSGIGDTGPRRSPERNPCFGPPAWARSGWL